MHIKYDVIFNIKKCHVFLNLTCDTIINFINRVLKGDIRLIFFKSEINLTEN